MCAGSSGVDGPRASWYHWEPEEEEEAKKKKTRNSWNKKGKRSRTTVTSKPRALCRNGVSARSCAIEWTREAPLSLSYHKPLEIHLIPYMSRHRNSLSLSLSLRHIHQIRTIKKNNKRIYKSETGSSHYKHNGCFKQIKRGGTWWRRRGGRRNNRHQFQSVYVRLGRYAQPFASNTHSDQNTPKHRIGLIFCIEKNI